MGTLCIARTDLFLHKMASPVLLIERHTPGVRLSCLKKCEKQDATKIFNLKCPEHNCRAHFLSKQANFGEKLRLSSHWTNGLF